MTAANSQTLTEMINHLFSIQENFDLDLALLHARSSLRRLSEEVEEVSKSQDLELCVRSSSQGEGFNVSRANYNSWLWFLVLSDKDKTVTLTDTSVPGIKKTQTWNIDSFSQDADVAIEAFKRSFAEYVVKNKNLRLDDHTP